MEINTIAALREHFVNFGGFTGGWNVILEAFVETPGFGQKIAVSRPVKPGSWLTMTVEGLAQVVPISDDQVILVITDWAELLRRVHQDALRERLLVTVTGNLVGEVSTRASSLVGGNNLVRRSKVGVAVGEPYWNPTDDQLTNGLKTSALPLP